jgi:hypothetical protein
MTIITVKDVKRGMTRRAQKEDGSFSWVPDGVQVADIDLIIDDTHLARLLGPKAMSSARRRSKLGHGAIIAEARNVRRLP